MFGNNQNPPPQGGGFPQHSGGNNNGIYGNIEGMAITVAIAATFIISPYITDFTEDFISEIFIEHYGSLAEALIWAWEILVFIFTFYMARAYVTAAVITIGMWVAARIPVLAI